MFEPFLGVAATEHLVKQTVAYAVQRGNHSFSLTRDEMKTFMGILLVSGYCCVPRPRLYWQRQPDVYNELTAASTRRDRFDEIMKFSMLQATQSCQNMINTPKSVLSWGSWMISFLNMGKYLDQVTHQLMSQWYLILEGTQLSSSFEESLCGGAIKHGWQLLQRVKPLIYLFTKAKMVRQINLIHRMVLVEKVF